MGEEIWYKVYVCYFLIFQSKPLMAILQIPGYMLTLCCTGLSIFPAMPCFYDHSCNSGIESCSNRHQMSKVSPEYMK